MKLILAALLGLTLAAPARAWENPDGPVRTIWFEAIGLKSYDSSAGPRSIGQDRTVDNSSLGWRLGWVPSPAMTVQLLASFDRSRVGDVQGKYYNFGVSMKFYLVRPER